jgi:hypothetical protein
MSRLTSEVEKCKARSWMRLARAPNVQSGPIDAGDPVLIFAQHGGSFPLTNRLGVRYEPAIDQRDEHTADRCRRPAHEHDARSGMKPPGARPIRRADSGRRSASNNDSTTSARASDSQRTATAAAGSFSRAGSVVSRTVITGHGAVLTTRSATLPSSACDKPVRPCVPITIRSNGSVRA